MQDLLLRLLALPLTGAMLLPGASAMSPEVSGDDVLLKTDEALTLAFGEADVTKERAFLDKAHRNRIAELAGGDFKRGIVNAYVARDAKKAVLGTAYFDTHKIRTKNATLMFVVDPEGKLARIEVLKFSEPRQYLPKAKWFAQLIGRKLDKKLSLKGEIKNLSGSTLSAREAVAAARRVLAQHQVIAEIRAAEEEKGQPPKEKPKPKPDDEDDDLQ